MIRAVLLFSALAMLHPPVAEVDESVCLCAEIQRSDGWCGKCRQGYLAGIRIESAAFFEAVDAHGHHINPATLTCEKCKKAYATFGYCADCQMGFVGKHAYFSKLTYYLARGEVTRDEALTCDACRKHTRRPGWCEPCAVGMVAHRAYRDRKEFDQAVRLRTILGSALELAEKCMSCALAIINDGTCVTCKVTFRDGKTVSGEE